MPDLTVVNGDKPEKTREEVLQERVEADLQAAIHVDLILIDHIRAIFDGTKLHGEAVFEALDQLPIEQLAILGRQSVHDRAKEIADLVTGKVVLGQR